MLPSKDHRAMFSLIYKFKSFLLTTTTTILLLKILGEEVYNNQKNHKPNNRNRQADEALVDRVNHVNGVRGNLNSSIK